MSDGKHDCCENYLVDELCKRFGEQHSLGLPLTVSRVELAQLRFLELGGDKNAKVLLETIYSLRWNE